PGWWRRATRLHHPPVSVGARGGRYVAPPAARPLLVIGATGTLGRAVGAACEARGLPHRLLTRREMDIAEPASVEAALAAIRPWAVVNAAGFVRVDAAEDAPDMCRRENAEGAAVLATACGEKPVGLVTFSTDLVFDGRKRAPYVERDAPAPLNVYGSTKAEAERRVLARHPAALVVRTSAFFGPSDEHNFVTAALRALAAGRRFAAADDAVVSPTYVPHLVDAALDLLIDGERGLWHLANAGAVTWAELAEAAAGECKTPSGSLERVPTAALRMSAPRPLFSALASERAVLLPPLDEALAEYASARNAAAAHEK
ncbi:MAG: SDR family oxidoreductase, partial [Actinomycetota bacterium]|nr:SDR family oxidoreductase [Actinomycetota bacterium]